MSNIVTIGTQPQQQPAAQQQASPAQGLQVTDGAIKRIRAAMAK